MFCLTFLLLFLPFCHCVTTVRLVDSQFDDLVDVITSSVKSTERGFQNVTDSINTLQAQLINRIEANFNDLNDKLTILGQRFFQFENDFQGFSSSTSTSFSQLQTKSDNLSLELNDVSMKIIDDYQPSNCVPAAISFPSFKYPGCYESRIISSAGDLFLVMNKDGFSGPYLSHGIIPLMFNNNSNVRDSPFFYKFLQLNSIIKWYQSSSRCDFMKHFYNLAKLQTDIFHKTGCSVEIAHYSIDEKINIMVRVLEQPVTQIKHSDVTDMYQMLMAFFEKSIYVNTDSREIGYRFGSDASNFYDYLLTRRTIISTCSDIVHNCTGGTLRLNNVHFTNPTKAGYEMPVTKDCYPFGEASARFRTTMPESYMTIVAAQDGELRFETLSLSFFCPKILREVDSNEDPSITVKQYEFTVNNKPQFVQFREYPDFKRLNIHRRFYPLSVVFHFLNGTTQPWLTSMYSADPNTYPFGPRCTLTFDTIRQIFYNIERDRSINQIWDCGFPVDISAMPSSNIHVNLSSARVTGSNSFPYYLSSLKNDFASSTHFIEGDWFRGDGYHIFNDSRNPVKLQSLGLAWFSVSGDSSSSPGYVIPKIKDKVPENPLYDDYKTVIPAVRRVRSAVSAVNEAINNFRSVYETIQEVKDTVDEVWAKVDAGLAIFGDIFQIAKKFI